MILLDTSLHSARKDIDLTPIQYLILCALASNEPVMDIDIIKYVNKQTGWNITHDS